MPTTTSLDASSSTFSSRNVPFREAEGSGALFFERDGASFRFSTTARGEIVVVELTSAPTFLAFLRDGTTFYEPDLSAEAAPVFSPKFTIDADSGTTSPLQREERRRAANRSPNVRVRVYDPSFLEGLLPSNVFSANELKLAALSPLKTGDRIAAFWNRSSGRFETVASPKIDVLRFQLTSPLIAGSTGNATALYFDSTTNSYLSAGLEITVADAFGTFSGTIGARGVARRVADRNVWEIATLVP